MKLPFLQHTGIGIHLGSRGIRWVELSRIRHKIFIRQSAFQAVVNGDFKTALCELVDRMRPSNPYVTANLNPADVHQIVLEVPFHDDEEELGEWLANAPGKLLPEDASLEEFAVCHYLYGDPEEAQNCLFVMARKEAVEARIELLYSAGLHPVILTTGDLEAGYGMMFDRNFIAAHALLIKSFENRGCLLEYQKGLLVGFHAFPEAEDAIELIEEAHSMFASSSGYLDGEAGSQIYLASEQMLTHSLSDMKPGIRIRELNPLSHLTFNNEILSPGLAVACGMAVKQLYPGLDTINMLEAACVTSNREAIEKKDAMITTAASGVVLLLTFLLLVLAGWILDNKKQQLDERLAVIEDKITAVEHARLQVHELRSSILQVRNLIDDRSSTVRHIEAVGRSLPEGVWLDELRLTAVSGTTNHFRLTIRGYALSERFISALLESLEQQKDIHGIRLVYSEQIDTQDIYKERAYQENTLVHYEIQMQAND